MDTEGEGSSCSLCGSSSSSENLRSLPPPQEIFLLRSLLQLPYNRVLQVLGAEGVKACGGCRPLMGEAFRLEEEAHILQLQIQRVREMVGNVLAKKGALNLKTETEKLKAQVDRASRNSSWQKKTPKPENSVTTSEPRNDGPEGSIWPEGEEEETEIGTGNIIIKAESLDLDQFSSMMDEDELNYPDSILPDLTQEDKEEGNDLSNSESELPSHFQAQRSTTSSIKQQNPSGKKVAYRCHYGSCGKTYYNFRCLRKHEMELHGDGNLRCSTAGCLELFEDYGILREHQSRCPGRPIACTRKGCDKRFLYNKFLHAHLKSAHSGKGKTGEKKKKEEVRDFKCRTPECVKAFPDAAKLAHHEYRCKFKYETLKVMREEEEK